MKSSETYVDWEAFRRRAGNGPQATKFGEWQNRDGFQMTLDPVASQQAGRTIWDVTMDELAPLMYVDSRCQTWTADKHYVSDLGSIPAALQSFCSPTSFPLSFLLHDSACLHKGLWIRSSIGKWIFAELSRWRVDAMLYDMIGAEGGSLCARVKIWLAVRAYARARYGLGDWRRRKTKESEPAGMEHEPRGKDDA